MPMQVSWIDADEVGALLGGLRQPFPEVKKRPEDSVEEIPRAEVVDAQQPSSAKHADLDRIRQRLDAFRSSAMKAGLLSPGAEVPGASLPQAEAVEEDHGSFQPQGGTVAARLAAYAQWAMSCLGDAELYVIGGQGELLWGCSSSRRGLIITTVMAWVAFTRMSGAQALRGSHVLRQPIADGWHLVALPCPTRLGLVYIAATGSQPVPDELAASLRAALIQAVDVV